MRRLSALALAGVLGASVFAATPANATTVSTCIVIVGVTVTTSPASASVDRVEVKSVDNCI